MELVMELVNARCCGIDVHKETVVACVRLSEPGKEAQQTVRTFTTTTRGLLELCDWLARERVAVAAMESTGVYWKPVWNLLEGLTTVDGKAIRVMLVNARHVKNVPGRKTDVKDCRWLAQLLAAGLLNPSFVPERPQRELRDLTRQRVQLIEDRTRVANRLQKVLEDANIKLAYHLLKRGSEYADLGGDYFEERDTDRLKRNLVKRLQQLGYEVNVSPKAA